MGRGASCGQDRRDRGEKGIAGRGGAHRPDQPDPDPFKRLPVPGRDPDCSVDQLVREDGGETPIGGSIVAQRR